MHDVGEKPIKSTFYQKQRYAKGHLSQHARHMYVSHGGHDQPCRPVWLRYMYYTPSCTADFASESSPDSWLLVSLPEPSLERGDIRSPHPPELWFHHSTRWQCKQFIPHSGHKSTSSGMQSTASPTLRCKRVLFWHTAGTAQTRLWPSCLRPLWRHLGLTPQGSRTLKHVISE